MQPMLDAMFQIILDKDETIKNKITRELFKSFFTKKIPSIKELSERCFVSQSMITKYSKSMGCSGYRELSLKIKIEIQNNGRPIQNEITNDSGVFKKNEDLLLKSINEISIDRNNIISIKNNIKNAKRIYIISSPSFTNEASNLADLLQLVKKEVVFFKSIKYSLNIFQDITNDDFIIFLIGGQDSSTSQFIYSNMKLTENNHMLFLTYSKFFLLEKAMNKILIDTNYLPHTMLSRKIILNYLFLQLFSY